MFSRQRIVAEGGSLAAGRDIIVQYGLTGTPASFRARVQRFLSYYLGSEQRPVPFGGRGVQLEQLRAWLADPAAPPNLLISAPAGRGKTAVLVRWLQSVDTAAWPVAFVPISIRFETNRPDIFYQALAARLAEVLGGELKAAKGDAAAVYKDKVIEQLDAFAESGKRCLLAIDGLDEATGWRVDTSVLPPAPVPGLRIVAGARVLAGGRGAQDWLRCLGWKADDTCILEVPPLNREGIAEVLHEMGVPLAGLAGDVDLLGELERLTEGDPLLLRFYVEDLWENRHQVAGLRPEDLRGREAGFGAYFKDWLAKQGGIYLAQGAAFDEQTIKAILVVLACALGPLRLADLVHLVRRLLGSERIISRDSLEPIQRFLIGGGREEGYALGHPKLGDYLRVDFFGGSEDVARAREVLVAWGDDTVRRLNAGELEPEKAPPYLLQFYLRHLKEAKAGPDRFIELVEDGWCRAWYAYEGGFRSFAHDVEAVLTRLRNAAAEREPLLEPATGLGARIRCALCLSSIRSIEANVPAELLTRLLLHGHISERHALNVAELKESIDRAESLAAIAAHLSPALVTEALAAARAIQLDWPRAEALAMLASHLPPDDRPAIVAEALEAARALPRAEALIALAPHLPLGLLARALEVARVIENEAARARALVALAPRLAPGKRAAVLAEALKVARAAEFPASRAETLSQVAPHLPPAERSAVLAEALEAARTVDLVGYRAQALTALVPHLPSGQRSTILAEALQAARAVRLEWPRAAALAALTPHLPPGERSAVLAEALKAARAVGLIEEHRADALASLLPHLPPEEQPAIAAEALEAARAIGHWRSRADALAALAPHLPPALLAEAFAAARAVGDEGPRSQALVALALHLPAGEQPTVVAQALEAARAVGLRGARAIALADLLPHLPPEERDPVLTETIETARAIADESNRVQALAALAPHLPPDERILVVTSAFRMAVATADEWSRVDALTALAPHLPPPLLPEALAVARAIADDEARSHALAALAGHLPPDQRPDVATEALAAARATADEESRVDVLASLASHLPPALITEALAIARTICRERLRADAVAGLAPHLPLPLLPEALALARGIADEQERSYALAALAPHLAPEERLNVLTEALEAARAHHGVDVAGRRAHTLAALALHLPLSERTVVLAEALEAARAVLFEEFRADELARLVLHLPPELLPSALDPLLMACARLPRANAIKHSVSVVLGIAKKEPGSEAIIRAMVAAIIEFGRRWP